MAKIIKFTISDHAVLKTICDVLEKIIEDTVCITANKTKKNEKLVFNIQNPSRTMYMVINLTSDYFTKYSCDKKLTLGINNKSLLDILKRADKDEIIKFFIDDENKNLLNIEFTNKNKSYKLKLSTVEAFNKDKQNIEIERVATINTSIFSDVVDELKSHSTQLCITCNNKNIMFSCVGDLVDAELVFTTKDDNITITNNKDEKENEESEPESESEDEEEKEEKEEKENKSLYDIKTLEPITKYSKIATTVDINMVKTDNVMILNYELNENYGNIKVIVSANINESINNNDYDYSEDDDEF